MTDRRRASGPDGRSSEEYNPFAPPPEGAPDQPWESRQDGNGEGGDRENGNNGQDNGRRAPWSRQWSSRQPGRQSGGFGQSENGGERPNRAPRWDPNDPKQRHARYALLAGAWGLFPALLGWEWLALFLAAFGLYWGVDALRGAPSARRAERENAEEAQAKAARDAWQAAASGQQGQSGEAAGGTATATASGSHRPTTTAAVLGVVLASLTLCMVVGNFAIQMVYQDFFTCYADALTTPSQEACESLLPEVLHPVYLGES